MKSVKLKRTPPKVVVIFDPPYQTYLGHMDFKRSQLIQQDFLAWMTEMQSADALTNWSSMVITGRE